jgi:dipeptide transport system substrate-binding protein
MLTVLRPLCGALLCAALGAHAASNLTVCTESSPDGFDIAQYESAVTNDAAGLTIYDQLLRFEPGGTKVLPALAESYDISPDGTVYTFHLRRGVKFHTTPWFTPTRDFNADDVVWSINRVNDKKHPAHDVARNGYVYWEGMGMSQLIKSVEKVDPLTVRITLTRAEAPFIADMAMSAIGSIFSAEYGEKLLREKKLQDLNTLPIGTGPFVFKSYQKDAIIRYTANKQFWGGAPKIDNLIFAITADPAVRIQRLKAEECLVGTNMKPDTASAFDGSRNLDMLRSSPLYIAYVAANAAKKPMSDRRFREALSLAFDRNTYARSVYGGNATPAGNFLPPGIWSYDKTLVPKFDPERAKQLVKESGYDGRELALYTRIGGSIDGKRAAELMQSDWAKVGIRVRVQMVEWGEMLKATGKGDHDITFVNWAGDNGDPDNFFGPNLTCDAKKGGGNKSQWCNKDFDALIEAARKISDIPKRTELYVKAQRVLYDDVGAIPAVYPVYLTAVNKKVKGFMPNPFANNDFRNVSIVK